MTEECHQPQTRFSCIIYAQTVQTRRDIWNAVTDVHSYPLNDHTV